MTRSAGRVQPLSSGSQGSGVLGWAVRCGVRGSRGIAPDRSVDQFGLARRDVPQGSDGFQPNQCGAEAVVRAVPKVSGGGPERLGQ